MPGTTIHSDGEEINKEETKTKDNSATVEGDAGSEEGGDGEEDGSEYEIEEVLDAKRGYFPDGRMGYLVKWKGYDHTDNSWVDEQDAGNAIDLVNEYWRKHPTKKKNAAPRKSVDKKTPKKGRKSAAPDETSDAETISTKKRGRKSTDKKSISEDEMDVDEIEEIRAPKKAKKTTSASQASKSKPRAQTPDDDDKAIGNMADYMHMKTWEPLVKTIDTVERSEEDGRLMVYFTLNNGEVVTEESTICKERFPRKLLDFYESNLRWRAAEDNKLS